MRSTLNRLMATRSSSAVPVAVAMLAMSATVAMPVTSGHAQEQSTRRTNWHGAVGAVAGSLESYYGTDARRTLGAPLIGIAYKDRLLFGTTTSGGLGGGLEFVLRRGTVGASLGVTGVEPRPEERADGLAGMDDRSGALFGTVGLVVRGGPAEATATTAVGLRQDAGVAQTLGLEVGKPILPRLTASIGGVVTFADRKNIMFDFGVTEEQAARRRELIAGGDGRLRASDTTAYSPKAGVKEVRGTLQMTYALHGSWQAIAFVSVGQLPDRVSESPLARKRRAVATAVGMTYGF
ncbi:MAG TPA: MipA/OmpV family protein [Gemmatimonadaceae bacterium]|jgi:outer membrane scaffolding protein for murein synthesis (MipA/OmpV family)|nr:MipA/OmpV family protein [Gemmatimonadaceae bacterium]